MPAGVISHASYNLIKENMGTETKGPSPCFHVFIPEVDSISAGRVLCFLCRK